MTRTFTFLAALLIAATAIAADPAADITKELTTDKPATRTAAQADALHAKALDVLLADLANEDAGKRGSAQSTLERIAFIASRPGAEVERAACAKAIVAKLADAPAAAKPWLIRQLERIGKADSVAALATAVSDKDAVVRDCARRALLKNPAPEAADPLRKALATADTPAWRIAIINALGSRRDPADVALLAKETSFDNDDVRIAALRCLAKLGDKGAVEAISAAIAKGSPAVKQVAIDSLLLLADGLSDKGDNASALGIYKGLLSSQGHIRCAAIIGIGRAGSAADLPTIFEAAADPDVKLRGACVEAMALLKGDDVTSAITAKVKTASPEAKPVLLAALARHGDKASAAVFAAAIEDANEAVRVEAARGLAVVGDASAVPLLLKLAAAGGAPQDAARWSLHRLKGDGVDPAILTAMDQKDAKLRSEVIRAMVSRHIVAGGSALLKSAEDDDAGVRSESIKALGSLATVDAVAPLLALLAKADDNSRGDCAAAIVSIALRESDIDKRSEPVLKALESATGPTKLALLGVLSKLGGPKSLAAVVAATKDNDAKVKDTAVRALADWPDASAAQDLLAIATGSAAETHQVLALRGLVKIVRNDKKMPVADQAKVLVAALQAAKRPDDKKQVLGGLAEVRHITALEAIIQCMSDAAIAQEAAQAAAKIGRDLADANPELVKSAMQKAMEISKNSDVQKQGQEAIDRAEKKLKEKKK